jgi:hypothetical protein
MYLPEPSNDLRQYGAEKAHNKLRPIYKQKIGLHAAVSSVTRGDMNSVYFIHQIHHELFGIMFDSRFPKPLAVALSQFSRLQQFFYRTDYPVSILYFYFILHES